MTTCTNPKAFSDLVEDFIAKYEEAAQDEYLEDIDSTPVSATLERLYAYRKAIKNKDYDYIRAQGFLINNREEQSKLATRVFEQVFSGNFTFFEGNSQYRKNGVLKKVEFVDGGIAVQYFHRGKTNTFTFSLTSDERSHTREEDNRFIRLPGFRKFVDKFNEAERNKTALQLVLGSDPGADFKLDDKYKEDTYIHGNITHMKDMLKKLHILGGEKASDKELEGHFNLLEKMDPKFFEKLKLYVQEDAETSKGVARPRRIDIKVKGDPISIGNQQSEASIYMEEVLHSMTRGAIASDTVQAAKLKRRLDHLMELARKQLKIEDFLPSPENSIDAKAERAFAEKLYNYILEGDTRDYEFLAKGIAQPLVSEALSKVKIKDTDGNKSFLTRLIDAFSFVLEVLSGAVVLKNKNDSVHDALVGLAFDMAEINTKASQKAMEAPGFLSRVLEVALNDPDRKISRALHNITKDTTKNLKEKGYEGMPDDLYGRTKAMAKAIGLSMVNPTYTKVMGSFATAYGLKPDGTIREIVSGLFETAPVQQAAEFLVLQAGLVDKYRNQQIALTRDNVLSQFKQALDKVQEEALTEVLSDTDLASLFGKNTAAYEAGIVKTRVFDNATLRKILEDDETLDKFIVEAKRALKDADSTHYNWHANQAVGLGIFMATHQGTPEQNMNATNIAKGLRSGHKKGAKKEVVRAIDELATLVAVKNTDINSRRIVASLMKDEWKGVQHVADIVEGFKANSIESVFKKNQTNMIKGYSREIFDDTIIMDIAPLSEREEMEAQGYTFKGKLAPKAGDPNKTPMALYVTDVASRPERLRGGIRLNQIRSRGETLTDAAYKEGEGYSNAFIRERTKREINSIQRDAIARAKKMEEGEYDFTDTVFGLVPVINEDGKVVDYRYMMDKKTKKEMLKQDTRISEVMARSFGSLLDKEASAKHNSHVLELLKKDMMENWEEGEKGIDGLTDFTLVGPDVTDPEMRKIYYMLPREFQEYIKSREDKTLAVRTSLKNLYFGYSQLSIMDFPMLEKFTPKVLAKFIRILEMVWMEVVQIAKTNILMKMPTVTISNFLSNSLYLFMKGYNPVEVVALQLDSYKTIKAYNKNVKRQQELLNRKNEIIVALGRDILPEARKNELKFELKKVNGELKATQDRVTSSRIHELVQMGLDQTVEDIANSVTRDTNRVSKFFDEKLENLPSVARTGIDYLFLTKRSAPYKIVNEFLEITDLMARDVQNTMEKRSEQRQANGDEDLPTWWLDKQPKGYRVRQPLTGKEKAQFLKEAEAVRRYELVEDYINYALPSSQFEEYLNKVGILMFTKYVKRIQRIIAKTGGRGPLKAVAGAFGAGYIGGLPTIHEQSFLAKEWYTDSFGAGNVFPIYAPTDIFMNVITPSLLKESTYSFGW